MYLYCENNINKTKNNLYKYLHNLKIHIYFVASNLLKIGFDKKTVLNSNVGY